MPIRQDTISAIATPIGEGGIGVVRISGPDAQPIATRLFSGRLADHRAVHGLIRDPATGEPVDEVLALLMRAPHTYTREDVVEIQGHGGPVPLRRILGLSIQEGARPAEPGEFTLRAFLNGRLDLTQAEAVLDVIQAKTDASLRIAVQGLRGRLSNDIHGLREVLLEVLAHLTARIDFPDDDVPAIDITPQLSGVATELERLIATSDVGMVYRQGLRVAIVGLPNVGKSSLLNRLLREGRAIVTDIPGTTRDTIEETYSLRGIPIVLTDTAGMNVESVDAVEMIGIERSRVAMASADFIMVVVDGSRAVVPAEIDLLAEVAGRPHLVVSNKADLPHATDSTVSGDIAVSALTGDGIADLEDALFRQVAGGHAVSSDETLVANVRHKDALQRALLSVIEAMDSRRGALTDDMVAIDVTAALTALGEITGDEVTEDLLDSIFSRFCIGK